MRRSFRDAIVGFSIIGGIVAFSGTLLWLRGIRLGAKTWQVTAKFSDASGLAERSPVTYRGILVGSVKNIEITPSSVHAKIHIDKQDLRLPKPVIAKVVNSSLLGGDVQIALTSGNQIIPSNSPLPTGKSCSGSKILCEGEIIQGESLTSISSLTAELEKLVRNAERAEILKLIVDSTKQFEKTQEELEELIIEAKKELKNSEPIILEITKASHHLRNILEAIDNPQTLTDIRETASSTRSLTKKIDDIGDEMSKIMEDKELMNAFRNVTIGLGQLFNEIYPAKTLTNN
tara:strand:+ start:378 stop:1244 length:867 start_codon:yes stop_codon:yes gene_type:complete